MRTGRRMGAAAQTIYQGLTDPRITTASLMFTMDGILRDPSLARQKSRAQSNVMRRDPTIQAPLAKRKLATVGLRWGIVPEDDSDEGQVEAANLIEKDIRGFDYEELLENLLEAIWFGPGPAEHVVDFDDRDRRFKIVGTRPIHGDSLVFDFDGNPYIRVGPGYRGR